MPEQIREAGPVVEATPDKTGRIRVTLISPGWGSSGYYGADVLEQAVSDKVWPAGTQCFIDHPGEFENRDRPERSVRDLAAVLTEDPVWTGSAVEADAQLMPAHAETLRQPEMANAIGMSIRASADVEMGEAEGRRGRIVKKIVYGESVDFVTRAGRGGRYQLIESARPSKVNARAVGHGIAEATANELREQLQQALRDAYGADDVWVWVRDFDDARVWFEMETPDASGTYEHSYTAGDSGVALSGDPTEVRAETTYVPVDPAADTPTQESQEDTMPQIEEGRLAQLEEAAGRVSTLESERDAARQEADQLKAQVAESIARTAARPIVAAKVAESKTLGARTQSRLVESIVTALPVADGKIADDALAAAVEAAVTAAEAEIADYARPAPAPLFGVVGSVLESATGGTSDITESDIDKAAGSAFGRTGA